MTNEEKIELIYNKTQELLVKANEKYTLNFDIDEVDINFNLRGRAAGMALYHYTGIDFRTGEIHHNTVGIRQCEIKYNMEAIEKDFDHIYNETIPHEIAHLVTWNERSRTGNQKASHGPKWRRVTIELGGTGKRCHSIGLTKARKVREWQYRLDSGRTIVLKTGRHNKIQRGATGFRVVSTGESIRARHFVGEVQR